MIGLVAGLLLCQGDPVSPSKLISEMMAAYSSAKTVAGSITLKQTIDGQGGFLSSEFQIERPNKFYLLQVRTEPKPNRWLVTADGKRFSYDEPIAGDEQPIGGRIQIRPRGRLVETMLPAELPARTVADVYSASTRSIGDRCVPLDIAVGRTEDLKFVTSQWASLKSNGETDFNGEKVQQIGGEWREYGTAPVSGKFVLLIGADKTLRFYGVYEQFSINGVPRSVSSEWTVKVKLNETLDGSKFKVVY